MLILQIIYVLSRLNSLRTNASTFRQVILLGYLILPLALNHSSPDQCWRCHVGQWLNIPAQVASADAIVVLGGDMNTRLSLAVELYHAGIAPELWYTGAMESSDPDDGSAAQIAAQKAMEWGVPEEAITLLASNNTWQDGEQIAATVKERGISSIVVVTNWYHGRRALCAIHHHLGDDTVQVYYQPAATPGFGPHDWWQVNAGKHIVTTELQKIIFYWGYYGLVPWIC